VFEGQVLTAPYYGFLLVIPFAGYLDHALGPRRLLVLSLLVGGCLSILTPVLTRQHPILLVVLRAITGASNVSRVFVCPGGSELQITGASNVSQLVLLFWWFTVSNHWGFKCKSNICLFWWFTVCNHLGFKCKSNTCVVLVVQSC
jgi:MFS family permease